MNLLRIVMASGSRLWKRAVPFPASASLIWNRVYTAAAGVETSFAAPRAATDEPYASTQAKRKMCLKWRNLSETGETVKEKLNEFMRDEVVSVTKKDLIRWAKLLYNKYDNHQHALHV